MNKYFLLMAITLPNFTMAAASGTGSDASSDAGSSIFSLSDDSTVGSVATVSGGWDMVAEQQENQTNELAELITENLGKIYVFENAVRPFKHINRVLWERKALGEATYVRTMKSAGDIEEANLVVIHFDGSDPTNKLLNEINATLKSGAKLMVICKKRMNSDAKLSTPTGLKRTQTMKRFYGLPTAPQHQHIVLFDKE